MEKAKSIVLAGMATLGPATVASGSSVVFWNEQWPFFWASLQFDWELMDAYGTTGWTEVDSVEYVEAYHEAWDVSCGCPTGYTPPCYWHASSGSAQWQYW